MGLVVSVPVQVVLAGTAEAVHVVEVGSRVDQASVVELPSGIDVAASVSVGTTKALLAWMNPYPELKFGVVELIGSALERRDP